MDTLDSVLFLVSPTQNSKEAHIGDASVVHIAKTFKNLEEIDLRKVKKLTDVGIRALADLDNIKAINLNNIELTTKMAKELAKFKKLEKLDAVSCELDDKKLKLLKNTPVKELNIDQNRITGYSLKHTLNNMKLRMLQIRNLNDLTEADITWFKSKNPQCLVIDKPVDAKGKI